MYNIQEIFSSFQGTFSHIPEGVLASITNAASSGEGFRFYFAAAVFLITFIAVATEKIHKTTAVLIGAALMLMVILPGPAHHIPEGVAGDALKYCKLDFFARYVNFDVVFTLAGMMVIVNVLSKTGLFQYVAIKSVKIAKGYPMPTMLLLVCATAVLSAFLDNVTTVLLVIPVTFLVASQMKLNPIPFLMAETMASNIGGTATLIGDPPNLIIGSAVNLDFMAFIINLTPFILILMGIFCVGLWMIYGKNMQVTVEQRAAIMEMDEKSAITDASTLKRAGFVMCLTLLGFILHGFVGLQPSVVALGGMALCLLLCKVNVDEMLEKIEWGTLFFFIGLFIVVEGAAYSGVMGKIGLLLQFTTSWHPLAVILAIMWCCGLAVAIVNNVSFTTVVVSLITGYFSSDMANAYFVNNTAHQHLLWWGIALAVCLGGNMTVLGAAANLVSVGIAKQNKHEISFLQFMKFGVPTTIISLIMASLYIVFRFYVIGK